MALSNTHFERDSEGWFLLSGGDPSCVLRLQGTNPKYAVVSGRKATWHGLAQKIETRLLPGVKYAVAADISIAGADSAKVHATVAFKDGSGKPIAKNAYVQVGSAEAFAGKWVRLAGTLNPVESVPADVVAYLEGPPGGVELVVASFSMTPVVPPGAPSPPGGHPTAAPTPQRSRDAAAAADHSRSFNHFAAEAYPQGNNVLDNGAFADGIRGWQSMSGAEKLSVHPPCAWGSPAGPPAYPSSLPAPWPTVPLPPLPLQASVSDTCPATSQCQFRLHAGACPISRGPALAALSLGAGLGGVVEGAQQEGQRALGIQTGGSGGGHGPPPMLAGPTGAYLVVSSRTATWQGPSQVITPRLQLFATYAVSTWVKVGLTGKEGGDHREHAVSLTIAADKEYVNCGQVAASCSEWRRCWGSFRFEREVRSAKFYVQGAPPGVDIWVADVRIMPVDRRARIDELRARAEKVRMRDMLLQVVSTSSSPSSSSSGGGRPVAGAAVSVRQTRRQFPLGCCLNDRDLRDPAYERFVVDHFNVAVCENQMKWTWNEPQRGAQRYETADAMLEWCQQRGIALRGHCLLWDNSVPNWAKALPDAELARAIDSRIETALTRYRGKLLNWDLDNEMLHGRFFGDRLGAGVYTRMFQLAHALDPSAAYMLNDFHVEDGCDHRSAPENYAELARKLIASGAPVGGLGVQGHVEAPVGPHMQECIDVLAQVGLPVWFTEVDVASLDENVRADDLEVMLRETFAHPAVEGVLLWGFWEGGPQGRAMWRKNAELVRSDWSLTEAGRRLEALLQEWTTTGVQGVTDGGVALAARGYLGTYVADIEVDGMLHQREFVLSKGVGPQRVTLSI